LRSVGTFAATEPAGGTVEGGGSHPRVEERRTMGIFAASIFMAARDVADERCACSRSVPTIPAETATPANAVRATKGQ
jgi:hypothetical protein